MQPPDGDGIGPEEYRQRQAFLGLTPADTDLLRALRPIFARHATQFAERFYQHLLADPHTAALLRDPRQLERLKTIQANYFAELLAGTFDDNYLATRRSVGRAHQRVGLEPQWYLGAYNQYLQITLPIFAAAFGDDLVRALPSLLALVKVVFLDIGLALDTYFRAATRELHRRNEELQQALDLYWRAQRREEEMRHIASHEIRGGLAAVITGLEDLQDRVAGVEAEDLGRVKQRCWDLTQLLTDLLTAGQQGGPGWVEPGTIFAQLQSRFGHYAQGRQIELSLPADAPRVWADPVQLREVFANLVSNSVRYIEAESGRVEIAWRPEGGFIRFAVRDNGPGIPPEVRERLFQPFVRGPNAAGRPGGTGLGLYFVRSMVEQNGGQIGIEEPDSRRGGAAFWFTVPGGPPGST